MTFTPAENGWMSRASGSARAALSGGYQYEENG